MSVELAAVCNIVLKGDSSLASASSPAAYCLHTWLFCMHKQDIMSK